MDKQIKAEACNFTKSDTPPWAFFTFFKLYKWHQMAEGYQNVENKMKKNVNEGKFRWKTSYEKENAKVHITRQSRLRAFQIGKIISSIWLLKLQFQLHNYTSKLYFYLSDTLLLHAFFSDNNSENKRNC